MRNLLRKPSEIDKRSAAAKVELRAARAALAAIDTEEAAALADSATFAAWLLKRAAAASEVDRLDRLAAATESAADAAAAAEADAQRRRQVAAAHKDAADLAERGPIEAMEAISRLLGVAQKFARQAIAAKAMNANLPDGETPIPIADILARDFGTEPRRDLKTRTVNLWVAETTGAIVGNQAGVVSEDGIHGQIHVMGGTMRLKCVKRSFHEIEYHPPTAQDWPGDFFSLLRLPRLDGPGTLFDGAFMVAEQVADFDVTAATAPRKRSPRPIQIELVPLEPWPPTSSGQSNAD